MTASCDLAAAAPTTMFNSEHECTTHQGQEGWEGGRKDGGRGLHPQGTNKEGWVHECQPIRVKSPFTSKPALNRFTPAAVSVHFMFAVNTDRLFLFLFTYQRHSFIKVNALRTPPRRSVCHQNASHDGEDCPSATCHYR